MKHGRISTCDAPRPIEAATPEIIDKVHDIVLTDQKYASLLRPQAYHMAQ